MYEAPVISNGFDTKNKAASIPLAQILSSESTRPTHRYTVVSFYGFGSVFSTPVATAEDAQSALERRVPGIEDVILNLHGNVALTVVDHWERQAFFISDFYGAASISSGSPETAGQSLQVSLT